MRLTTAVTTTVLSAATVVAIGAAPGQASPARAGRGQACATQASYDKVQPGQSLAQVRAEMGSAGTGTVTRGHGPGSRDLEQTWEDCSVLGVPVKGALQLGIDLQADAGKPLRVVGKAELPPTSVPGLTYLLGANG